jgi:hypothetical protein
MKEREMRMSFSKALCSSFLCGCCGFIAVHFWAPTFKWGISIANVADFSKPPEKLSYPQQLAVTATGVVWSRYSQVITPVSLHPSLQLIL